MSSRIKSFAQQGKPTHSKHPTGHAVKKIPGRSYKQKTPEPHEPMLFMLPNGRKVYL